MRRDLDIIVWGASGFTGRLVCEHLATHYQVLRRVFNKFTTRHSLCADIRRPAIFRENLTGQLPDEVVASLRPCALR